MKNKITYRKVEEQDKKDLFNIFHEDNSDIVRFSYSMLGLDKLTDIELLERMIKVDAEIILREGKFLGVIETTPYDSDSIEIRLAMEKFDHVDQRESEAATEKFILKQLEKHGVSRIIIEVHKQFDLAIKHLLSAGYKVVSTINDAVTFEFDFKKLNKK
ncbi:hypothetical protein [Spiroplasma endosymbiont of Othius punctulatus]|uniref:hypothetical protein n=1 Tax=Spiroplasma endosymbiont of Othius punctulatus TaxID=3066289 RepID=UPI0030CB7F42